jgi:hypothetical protein
MSNPTLCQAQCPAVLARFVEHENYCVVLLSGSGHAPAIDPDIDQLKRAIANLGEQPG